MKPTILALSLIAPLTAAAQTSPVEVYGLLDAGVVVERGCQGAVSYTHLTLPTSDLV